jgi:hypothetical protein
MSRANSAALRRAACSNLAAVAEHYLVPGAQRMARAGFGALGMGG